MVFRTGLLSERAAADIGWARGAAVGAARRARGGGAGRCRRPGRDRRARRRIEVGGGGAVEAVRTDGERLDADAVVLAVPHDVAADLLPPGALGNGRDNESCARWVRRRS